MNPHVSPKFVNNVTIGAAVMSVPNSADTLRIWPEQTSAPSTFTYYLYNNADAALRTQALSRANAITQFGEATILAGEDAARQTLELRRSMIAAGQATWQYAVIQQLSQSLGWPRYFAADLTEHDAFMLARDQPDTFLWSVRETGTWLYTPQYAVPIWRQAHVRSDGATARYYLIDSDGATELTAAKFAVYPL